LKPACALVISKGAGAGAKEWGTDKEWDGSDEKRGSDSDAGWGSDAEERLCSQ
jgi:hypothetical protein